MLKTLFYFTLHFLWLINCYAAPLPDLVDLPDSLDLAPIAKLSEEKIKVPDHILEKQSLANLKSQINDMSHLKKATRLKLISLIEELQGHPDQAYLSFKKVPKEEGDMWHAFRELYLSDLLGLEEDTHKLAHLINERLQLKQLKVKKIAFCRSVKGYGIYDPVIGSISSNKTVILYVEINHLEQQLQSGQFKSSCKASFDIRDQNGQSVFHFNYPTSFTYEAKSSLSDYFIWMKWTPNLTPGKYTMHLKIEDEKTQLSDTKTLDFELL